MSVADVFEAYTAERPYHAGRSAHAGMDFLHQEAQRGHLDHQIVAVLANILRERRELFQLPDEPQAA